jgi:hypothetical protein
MAIDLKQFGRNLMYTASAPIPEVLADLQAIVSFDRLAEAKKRQFNNLLIGCFLVGFLAIILLAGLQLTILGLPLLWGAIGVGIVAAVMLGRYGHRDLADHRYQLLQKTLDMLTRDTMSGAVVQVRADLGSALQAHKKTETTPHPHRKGWKIDHFVDPWLQLEGEFLDGTRFTLVMSELHIKQYGWKRGRSGKSKYKTKTKAKAAQLNLTLQVPRKKYGALSILEQDASGAIQLPASVRLKQFKLSDNRLTLVTKTPPWFGSDQVNQLYQTLVMMLMSLYQILNLARVLSKPKS